MTGRIILPFALFVGACSPAEIARENVALAASIDSIVELTLGIDPTPGMSVAVVRGGDTIVLRGYGLADLEAGAPVTSETVFPIGSITKSFTAAAVMKLVEDGRLSLDDALGDVLPEYRGPGRAVTIHHLLNHTSGIPSYTRSGSPYWEAIDRDRTDAEMLALFAGEPLVFEPGTGFRYNNSGYYLLGRVVERVSGTRYEAFVEERLLRPVGVHHTGLCHDAPAVPVASGYEGRLRGPVATQGMSRRTHEAAGALCATPRDLVRWFRALDGGEVVSPSSYARMTTPAPAGAREDGARSVQAGYGLFMQELEGHALVGHTGGIPGFTAVTAHYPENDLTIAVLANGPAPVWTVEREIARTVLGLERRGWD